MIHLLCMVIVMCELVFFVAGHILLAVKDIVLQDAQHTVEKITAVCCR